MNNQSSASVANLAIEFLGSDSNSDSGSRTRTYSLAKEFCPHVAKLSVGASASGGDASVLQNAVDLRDRFPPCFYQGIIGSCTANALVAVYYFQGRQFMGSRLFLYYNERLQEGATAVIGDNGSTISRGMEILSTIGMCSEAAWPYDIVNFNIRPPPPCYEEAQQHKVVTYNHIDRDEIAIKASLQNKLPVILGIAIYESFESADVATSGIVPMPDLAREKMLGYHAVVIVGYNDNAQHWIMRNSWGVMWGDAGYFFLPFSYLTVADNLATDMWVMTRVSDQIAEVVATTLIS